jgi:hypothetical protein
MKIKKFFFNSGPQLLFKNKIFLKEENLIEKNFNILSFGNKNKNIYFYIIRRSPGSGLFSNITIILNHLKICKYFNFIPVIDMQNFTTIYNEKKRIFNTYNAWEYYFNKLNKYSLNTVYKSKNVIFCQNTVSEKIILDMTNSKIKKFFKLIKIKKRILNKARSFFFKKFKPSDKILGVHFRGSTYKIARGHAFPATPKLMIKKVDNLIKKFKYNKIFLTTEEKSYLEIFKNKYKDMCFYYDSYRMKDLDSFNIYPRRKHRYKLGEESLIDAIILSKCHGLAYIRSNLVSAAILMSNIKQKNHEIFLGFNSRNKFISRWLWYLKSWLPTYLGGLKIYNN